VLKQEAPTAGAAVARWTNESTTAKAKKQKKQKEAKKEKTLVAGVARA